MPDPQYAKLSDSQIQKTTTVVEVIDIAELKASRDRLVQQIADADAYHDAQVAGLNEQIAVIDDQLNQGVSVGAADAVAVVSTIADQAAAQKGAATQGTVTL